LQTAQYRLGKFMRVAEIEKSVRNQMKKTPLQHSNSSLEN